MPLSLERYIHSVPHIKPLHSPSPCEHLRPHEHNTLLLYLALPQGWARDRVASDRRVGVEQNAGVSGLVELSCKGSGRERFGARACDGNVHALRIVLHAICTRGTMGTEHHALA